ncbi:MAG: S8 family serine peptidase [Bacteroidota bacterium]
MKQKILIALITWLFSVCAFAQTSGGYLYVKPTSMQTFPMCDTCFLTNNAGVNSLFVLFGVHSYKKAFPGTTSSKLKDLYRIQITGNLKAFDSILKTLNYFEKIERGSIYGSSLGDSRQSQLLKVHTTPTYPPSCSSPDPKTNDPAYVYANDLVLQMSNAYCAWTITKGNPNVQIAVIDEPIHPYHDDFKDLSGNYKVTNKTPITLPNDDSHGVRVTSVICAQSNNSRHVGSIGYNLKVNHYGYERDDEILPLIWQAYLDGNKVFNFSLDLVGTTGSSEITPTEKEMFAEMIRNGCTFVAAGGNENDPAQNGIWDLPGFIIVGGVGPDNNHSTPSTNGIKTANHEGIDLCALANNVTALDIHNGTYGIADFWGTSAATPQVTATVGLMLSVNPCLRPEEIETILKSTTDPIADANLYPGTIGTGRLNTYRAVLRAQNWGNENLVINSGEVKNIESMEYYKYITVNAGGILNINNTTLFIAENGRISIDVGGRINVNYSTIKAREPYPGCEFPRYKWDGIAVAGNKLADQSPITNQGYIFVNHSTIQDANTAISTYLIDIPTGNIIWSKAGGGIVKTVNATFKSNGRHIEFYSYQRTKGVGNISSFIETSFEFEGSIDVASGNKPYYMITAWGVNGVTFSGCTFSNTNGSVDAEKYGFDRGIGILALDASLLIQEKKNTVDCSVIKNGSFFDLSTGIQITGSPSTTFAHRVKKQTFNSTDRSIWLSSGLGTSIDHNVIDLAVPINYYNRLKSKNDLSYKTGIIGVYAPKSAGYKIEQNDILNIGTKTTGQVVVGFVADNSDLGGGGGSFRLNNVDNANIATQTQNNNDKTLISCNTFKNTNFALHLNPLSPLGRSPFFSECVNIYGQTRDYGNAFISNNLDALHGISSGSNFYKTYVVLTALGNNPITSNHVALKKCLHLNPGYVGSLNCDPLDELKEPCNRVGSVSLGDYKTKYFLGKQAYQDVFDRIDDGSNYYLLQLIMQGGSIPASQLYTTLMSKSPYLSDEILIAVLDYSNHLSEQEKLNILIANAGLSTTVYNSVLARGFLSTTIDAVNEAQSNMLASEMVEREKESLYRDLVNLQNDIIWAANNLRFEQTDDQNAIDYNEELITFLSAENDLMSKKQLVSTCYLSGRYDDALEYLQYITPSGGEDIEVASFIEYYNLLISVSLDSRNIYSMTENEWSHVEAISLLETTAGEAAKGILTLVKGRYFEPYIEREVSIQGKRSTTSAPSISDPQQVTKLILFPNPSTGFFTINYKTNAIISNSSIRVLDVTGKLIVEKVVKGAQGTHSFDNFDWENGLYFVQLIVADKVLSTEKIAICK